MNQLRTAGMVIKKLLEKENNMIGEESDRQVQEVDREDHKDEVKIGELGLSALTLYWYFNSKSIIFNFDLFVNS